MKLRTIVSKDRLFIHKVRNHPDIAKVSHKQEGRIIIWKNKKVGYIIRSKGLISIAILPRYQHKGIGIKALKTFCRKGDKAEILSGNLAAAKVFFRVGFKPQYTIYVKE